MDMTRKHAAKSRDGISAISLPPSLNFSKIGILRCIFLTRRRRKVDTFQEKEEEEEEDNLTNKKRQEDGRGDCDCVCGAREGAT